MGQIKEGGEGVNFQGTSSLLVLLAGGWISEAEAFSQAGSGAGTPMAGKEILHKVKDKVT